MKLWLISFCVFTIAHLYSITVIFIIAVSNAFGVLNDEQKRQRYDQFGEEKDVPSQHYQDYYSNEFECKFNFVFEKLT